MKAIRIFTLALIAISYLAMGPMAKITEGQSEEEVIHFLPSNPTSQQRDDAIRELQIIVGTHLNIPVEIEVECPECARAR